MEKSNNQSINQSIQWTDKQQIEHHAAERTPFDAPNNLAY